MAANPNNASLQQQLADRIYYGVGQAMQAQQDAIVWFQSIPTTQKFIVVGIFALIVFAIIYGFYVRSRVAAQLSFDTAPSFLTDLDRLHNTKLPYVYQYANGRQVDHLPANLFPTSNNSQFTWSFWISVNGFDPQGGTGNDWGTYRFGQWKHVLSHGSGDIQPDNPDNLESLQYPGIWLHPKKNNMSFVTSIKGPEKNVQIDLKDIPLNDWFHVTFILNEMSVALYLDGDLVQTAMLPSAPRFKPNRNVYITNGGGFAGNMYFVNYQNTALEPNQVRLLYKSQKGAIDAHVNELNYDKYVKREFRVQNISRDPSVKTGASSSSGGTRSSTSKELNTFREKAKGWW